jgi:WD40 repeat protein
MSSSAIVERCSSKSVDDASLYDICFASSTRSLSVGSTKQGTGSLIVTDIDGEGKMSVRATLDYKAPLKCIDSIASSSTKCICGDFVGALSLWDVQAERQVASWQAHGSLLNALDARGDNCTTPAEISTVGRDGFARLWDLRRPERAVVELNRGTERCDCWSTRLNGEFAQRSIAMGYDDGCVGIYDLRAARLRWKAKVARGICSIDWRRGGAGCETLAVSTVDNRLVCFNVESGGSCELAGAPASATVWRARFIGGGGGGDAMLASVNGAGALQLSSVVNAAAVPQIKTIDTLQVSSQPLFSLAIDRNRLLATSLDHTIHLLTLSERS